jgi:carbamoyl-phosphate synthase large subunit
MWIVKFRVGTSDKFEGADRTLGLQMKSVRSNGIDVPRSCHKGPSIIEIKRNGLGADGKGYTNHEQIIEKLTLRVVFCDL